MVVYGASSSGGNYTLALFPGSNFGLYGVALHCKSMLVS